MHIFRHVKTKKLYYIAIVSPRGYTGNWMESEDCITGETKKLNNSSWKFIDFVKVCKK